MALAVVFDANVLYGIALTDFFITASARTHLYRMHWSTTILEEVVVNLLRARPDLGSERVRRRIDHMKRAVPGAFVDPDPALIEQMTNAAEDRHVLAAAVAAEAEIIVTFNLRHFSAEACAPVGAQAQHPDAFADFLVARQPAAVWEAIGEMADRRRNPPATPDEIVERLAEDLPMAIQRLRMYRSQSTTIPWVPCF